jgi:hypothetical protein
MYCPMGTGESIDGTGYSLALVAPVELDEAHREDTGIEPQ